MCRAPHCPTQESLPQHVNTRPVGPKRAAAAPDAGHSGRLQAASTPHGHAHLGDATQALLLPWMVPPPVTLHPWQERRLSTYQSGCVRP